MAKSTCKCKKAECEECPEWIFTFADLVMLMMGFFVILWVTKPSPNKNITATANGEETDQIKVEEEVRRAFGYIPDPNSGDVVDHFMLMNGARHPMLTGPHNGGQTDHEKGTEGTDLQVTSIRPSKHVTEGGKMLFDVGSFALNPDTKTALDEMAKSVNGHMNIVLIKGHTSLDDFPEQASPQQKMDLSIKRAQAAADYMVSQGVEPRILRVQGCSTFEPLTQHQYDADSQDENRRIDVEVTDTHADDVMDKSTTRPAADNP